MNVIIHPEQPPEKWHQRSVVRYAAIGLAAAVIGVGIGVVASPTDVETSPQYRRAQDVIAQKNDALDQSVAALEQAGDALETVEGDLPAREAAVADQAAQLAERETAVSGKEQDVAAREKAVGAIEREIANNTISGDGVYLVGVDMKAGTYRSEDNVGCYWAANADPGGESIINNDIGDGTRFAQVSADQYFETSGCSDWVLQ